jgi:hypothetical protein
MTTALYCRVSTLDQTLEHQRTQAHQEVGFNPDLVLADHGVSGVSTRLRERPEGRRLFDILREGDTLGSAGSTALGGISRFPLPPQLRLWWYQAFAFEPATPTVDVAPPPVNARFAPRCILAEDRGRGSGCRQQKDGSSYSGRRAIRPRRRSRARKRSPALPAPSSMREHGRSSCRIGT